MRMLVLKNPENGELICVPKFPKVVDAMGNKVESESDPHEGWEVLDDREGPPPEHADFIPGQGFVVNQERRKREKEKARLNSLSREEFMAEVMERIAKGNSNA
jgi:hypothetical protein